MSRSPAPEVVACRELSLGSHIATPRGAYVHHGIYVGNGLVVHYGGLVRGLRAGPIEVVSIEQFTQGRPLHVILASSPYFSGAEIVQRALSRVGEDRYHVLTNNCEHFCEWCVRAAAAKLSGRPVAFLAAAHARASNRCRGEAGQSIWAPQALARMTRDQTEDPGRCGSAQREREHEATKGLTKRLTKFTGRRLEQLSGAARRSIGLLFSDAAAFVVGHAIVIAGGQTVWRLVCPSRSIGHAWGSISSPVAGIDLSCSQTS